MLGLFGDESQVASPGGLPQTGAARPGLQPLPIRTPQQHRSSRGSLPSAAAPAGAGGGGRGLPSPG